MVKKKKKKLQSIQIGKKKKYNESRREIMRFRPSTSRGERELCSVGGFCGYEVARCCSGVSISCPSPEFLSYLFITVYRWQEENATFPVFVTSPTQLFCLHHSPQWMAGISCRIVRSVCLCRGCGLRKVTADLLLLPPSLPVPGNKDAVII